MLREAHDDLWNRMGAQLLKHPAVVTRVVNWSISWYLRYVEQEWATMIMELAGYYSARYYRGGTGRSRQ